MNASGHEMLKEWGVETIIQAGSFSYPYREATSETDENCMCYNWENNETIDIDDVLGNKNLPEMHIWLKEKTSNNIIDFSTFKLPICVTALGLEWTGTPPPDFIWKDIGKATYEEKEEATDLVQLMLYSAYYCHE